MLHWIIYLTPILGTSDELNQCHCPGLGNWIFKSIPLPWLEHLMFKSITALELSGYMTWWPDLLTHGQTQPFLVKDDLLQACPYWPGIISWINFNPQDFRLRLVLDNFNLWYLHPNFLYFADLCSLNKNG